MMGASEDRFSKADIPRDERPIRLGSLLYTIVQPRAGYEAAYNRWYERDHFYSGCMIGEYQFAGGRFVATKDCKALRYGNSQPGDIDPAKGSFIAIYWVLDGFHDEWNDWATKQVNILHSQGRMFLERDHIHTGLYRFGGEFNAPGSTMPIELALDRAYGGIVTLKLELADGVGIEKVRDYLAANPCPGDVMLVADPLPLLGDSPKDVPVGSAEHVVLVYFSIEDPRTVWAERYAPLGKALEDAGLGRVSFASPFISTVVGTDTYMDQL
jgi:hypothetical protein